MNPTRGSGDAYCNGSRRPISGPRTGRLRIVMPMTDRFQIGVLPLTMWMLSKGTVFMPGRYGCRFGIIPSCPCPPFVIPCLAAGSPGFLFPSIGYDNVLGAQYRQGFFWALTPSQDLLLTPYLFSKRGQGGDVGYRYVLNQQSQGKWLVSTLNDTDKDRVMGADYRGPRSADYEDSWDYS